MEKSTNADSASRRGQWEYIKALHAQWPEFWSSMKYGVYGRLTNFDPQYEEERKQYLDEWLRRHHVVDEWLKLYCRDQLNQWFHSKTRDVVMVDQLVPFAMYSPDEPIMPDFRLVLEDPGPLSTPLLLGLLGKSPENDRLQRYMEIQDKDWLEPPSEMNERIWPGIEKQWKAYVTLYKKRVAFYETMEINAKWTALFHRGWSVEMIMATDPVESKIKRGKLRDQRAKEIARRIKRFETTIGLTSRPRKGGPTTKGKVIKQPPSRIQT